MKRLFSAVLLLLCSGPAHAEWVAVAQTSSATIYVDPGTVRSTEGLIEVGVIFDYQHRQRLGNELHYFSIKRLYRYDCANEWSRLLATTFFLGSMGKGHVVEESAKEDIWRPVPPTGVGRTLLEFVCKK
jgi:hypothetical protein